MSNIKLAYATAIPITCTLANLSTGTLSGSGRISDAQDNSGGLYLDAALRVQIALLTGGTTGNDNNVYIYFYGSQDGSHYSDDATGVDSSYKVRASNALAGPFTLPFPQATGFNQAEAYVGSVAQYFGGILPVKWGIVVLNKTNVTFNTGTLMTASYTPIYQTVV